MSKKNIKKMQEQLKKLQAQMKEVEKDYCAEIGVVTLKWLQGEKNIAELEEKIEAVNKKFGIAKISVKFRF